MVDRDMHIYNYALIKYINRKHNIHHAGYIVKYYNIFVNINTSTLQILTIKYGDIFNEKHRIFLI